MRIGGNRMRAAMHGIALTGLALAVATELAAWGAKGHRIVARIAEAHLSPEAAAAVASILGRESLVDAANWADEIKSDPAWDHADPWHYVNVPDGRSYAQSRKNPAGDAYTALLASMETLADPRSGSEERANALRWVTHLVGDLHQPLHVGRAEDRGGNDVEGFWFGRPTNAHRIWDTELIEHTGYSFSEYAEIIDRRAEVKIEPGPEPEVMRWLEESQAYRDRAYTLPDPSYGGSYRYAYEHLDLVERRLKQAGLRLALTLNALLGDAEVWSEMPNGLHWMRNSAEYGALTRQVFADATRRLEALVAEGALGSGAAWAVSLDADETVLDNSQFAKEARGAAFDSVAWDAWCEREEATAVPGAVDFARSVKALGGVVAIVSNRSIQTQAATESNLRALGVPFDVVLLREATSDKAPRWRALREGRAKAGLPAVEIALYLGDNIHDFPGWSQATAAEAEAEDWSVFGDRYFALPNPTYGSFERKPRR